VAGAWVGSPFFLLKVRLQAQTDNPSLAVGYQHNYQGFFGAVRDIYNSEGIKGFWRGATTQMLRVGVGSMAQLLTYDYSRHFFLKFDYFNANVSALPFASSLIAGFALCLAMNPVDVVATRLYNQEVTGQQGTLYKGTLDCIVKIMRREGIQGFFKGLAAHYLRVGPHTIATFVFWDLAKSLTAKLDTLVQK